MKPDHHGSDRNPHKFHPFSTTCPCSRCSRQRARNQRAEERMRMMKETINRG